MAVEERFRQRYASGDTPWDIGKPDVNLIQTVTTLPLTPCKALDIGCGSGDNSVWLAQQNFQVTGVDVSEIAMGKAQEKACQAKVTGTFLVMNFLTGNLAGGPFGFAFDRGFFHAFHSDEERRKCAEKVAAHLEEKGLWLTLVGSADDPRPGPGPPRRTARDIVQAVEPFFEILSLVSGHFGSARPDPPRAWVCLMRKRVFA